MEVHHHGHVHHQKKWKEYLFQFLMLFIAVFCGFLAEYQLEHFIEKERAKELGRTLYEELRSDSSNLQQVMNNRLEKEDHLRYVHDYLKDSNLVNFSGGFYPRYVWSFFASTYVWFEPKDGMLEQLKNSGSLRYFRNIELQKAIGDLSVAVNNLRTRLERETTLMGTLNRDYLLKHVDMEWIDRITQKGTVPVTQALRNYEAGNMHIPGMIRNLPGFDKEAVCNILMYDLHVLGGTRKTQMKVYADASSRLLKILRDKYHF